MAVIDDIKALKHISDNSQDNILSIYIRRADTAIGQYLNDGSDSTAIETNYPDAVIAYAIEALNRQGDEGVKVSEISSVQNTYELGISETVASLLPPPSVTLMG